MCDFEIFIVPEVCALAVDQRAGGADLHAGAARNAGAFTKRYIDICNDHGGRAAFFNAECEIARHFSAGTDAAPAEDAAIVIKNKKRVAGVNRIIGPLRLHGPVGHVFFVGRVLQFAIAAADLTEWTEMIAFAEQK